MSSIPLIRVSQLFPFLEFLDQIGSPIEKLLRQVDLPCFNFEQSNSLIPEYSVWLLIEQAAKFEGIEDFGLQVALKTKVEDIGLLGQSLLNSPTLDDILNNFLNQIRWHSSDACFWLRIVEKEAWFCRQGINSISIGSNQVELYTLIYMIKIVQQITGEQWQPTKVYLQMDIMPSLFHNIQLSEVEIYFNQQFTAIAFPRDLLQKNRSQFSKNQFLLELCSDIWNQSIPATDFSGSIAQILESLLPHNITNIDLLAKLTGLSTRSLQRQLAKRETNYSDLLEVVRRQKAIILLKDSKLNLTDIAHQLGYANSANFCRAFKRWTNFSPGYFRQQHISSTNWREMTRNQK